MLPKLVLQVRKSLHRLNRGGPRPPAPDGGETERAWRQMLALTYREAAARDARLTELEAALNGLRGDPN